MMENRQGHPYWFTILYGLQWRSILAPSWLQWRFAWLIIHFTARLPTMVIYLAQAAYNGDLDMLLYIFIYRVVKYIISMCTLLIKNDAINIFIW